MQCTSPRTVGFYSDGKTLCWSPKHYSKEYSTFQIACQKCLACRLENSRQTAVRCTLESQMHEKSSFITLTYANDKLPSDKLQYAHIQKFIKDLRGQLLDNLQKKLFPNSPQIMRRKNWNKLPKERRDELYEKIRISVFTAGEYGDEKKRPHWHLLIFNYRPEDQKYLRTSERGDKIYQSPSLDALWGFNDPELKPNEIGEITFESAGYCARYAAKKLYHGKDGTHDWEPISKRSSKNAIGKKWIEKYWKQTFTNGYITLKRTDGTVFQTSIPRYFERWLSKNHPEEFKKYISTTKLKIQKEASEREAKITLQQKKDNLRRSAQYGLHVKYNKTKKQIKEKILSEKFKALKGFLKL